MSVDKQVLTNNYALYLGDCVEVLASLPDESVHLSIYSPPFPKEAGGALYSYSSSERDLSNCRTYQEFLDHYEYVVQHVARLTLPGRLTAVHCMDIPKQGGNIAGYTDFPGDIIRLHEKHGFEYLPRICIWKEPLSVRNRTMAKALAHRQVVEDSTGTNVAAADYLIPMRKRGTNPTPVTHPTGLTNYAGERAMPPDLMKYRRWEGKQTENRYSHWIWRQYASSFWDDIRGCGTRPKGDSIRELGHLPHKESRDKDDERHVHPLQLDVIERACVLWTNPGETVMTPFMGVGSEVWGAVACGRRGIGVELKPAYFNQAQRNLPLALDNHDPEMLFAV